MDRVIFCKVSNPGVMYFNKFFVQSLVIIFCLGIGKILKTELQWEKLKDYSFKISFSLFFFLIYFGASWCMISTFPAFIRETRNLSSMILLIPDLLVAQRCIQCTAFYYEPVFNFVFDTLLTVLFNILSIVVGLLDWQFLFFALFAGMYELRVSVVLMCNSLRIIVDWPESQVFVTPVWRLSPSEFFFCCKNY